MGSSLTKSHLSRSHPSEHTGQVMKFADPAASAPTRSATQCREYALIVIASGRISTARW